MSGSQRRVRLTKPAGHRTGHDGQLLRQVTRRIGVQTGILVLAAFCLCAGVLLLVVLQSQKRASGATLRAAVARADDVGDPPNGTWLVVRSPDGHTATSPGAPQILPYQRAISALLPAPKTGTRSISSSVHSRNGNDVEYRILTAQRQGYIVQAAISLAPEHAERKRLLEALAVFGALAIAVAGVLGALAGRRSATPLALALARQRNFVADASHELRTPLTHLTTRAQLVQRSLRRGDLADAAKNTDRLLADGRRLAATLEDLLSAAEPADPSQWPRVDLADVAADGCVAVSVEADAAGVTVSFERPVPADAVEAAAVIAPRTAVDRALLALLDNAIRHTPAGGSVSITTSTDRRWASLAVIDTGSGIPPGEQERLFDRFAHGERTHGGRRRFGLGLALVADTAERLGGELSFTSELGEGTTMTIRLPIARVEF